MEDEIVTKLNILAEFQAQQDLLNLEKRRLIDDILTPEIKEQLEAIENEFADKSRGVNANIDELANAIKSLVVTRGASVKGEYLQAVYTKPRVTWDTKMLEGFALARPELMMARKIGDPSVSIRGLK